MDIQTQDGILLRGIPDGTPDDVIKARLAQIRGQSAPKETPQTPQAPATLDQKIQSSAPMRFVQGLRDPIDAGAQVLSRFSPEWFTNALDFLPEKMRNSNSPFLQTIGHTLFADPRPGAIDKSIVDTEKSYQAARQATAPKTLSGLVTGQSDPGFDGMRLLGNVFSPVNAAMGANLPAAALSTGGRMAGTGAALGAAGWLLTPVNDEQGVQNFGATKAAQVGIGGATGAVLTPLLGKAMEAAAPHISRAIDRFTGGSEARYASATAETNNIVAQALADIGQRIEDIPKAQYQALRQQVNDALKKGQKLDAAAVLRKQDFDILGLPYTQGQISRDPMQFANEKNLRGVAGIGEPLMHTFETQGKQMQKLLGGFADGASESYVAGDAISKSLKATDEAMRTKVGAAYKVARESAGKDLDVPIHGLAQDAAGVIEDFADKVPTAIRNKLGSYGILDTGNQTKVFTFAEADKLLKSINDHIGTDAATNKALGSLSASVKKAMLESGADDVYAPARAAAAARFKLHDAVPAIEAASTGSVAPDAFVRRFVINGNTKEVKGLAEVLKSTSPEAYQEARAQIGAQIQRAAFGENMAGDKAVAPERLAKALRDIGTEKLSAFFTEAEIATMKRLARVGAYTNSIPNASVVNHSGTGATALNLMGMIPGLGAVSQAARAVATPIMNQRAVSAAMAGQVPHTPAPVSPELIRRLQLGAAYGGLLGGAAAAPR